MHKKTIYFALVAYLVFNAVDAKKTRRNKRPKDEDSTPQPNVVTYSTFGFNDVGTYDGFVPSSPDYANYLSNYNQESSTRLYAPAFPTAMDSPGFDSNFGSQSQDARPFNVVDDNTPQASMLQYPQSSMSFYNTPSLDTNDGHSQTFPSDDAYGHYAGEVNSPVYGTKLSSKNVNRPLNFFNNSEFNVFGSGPSHPSDDKFSSFHEVQSTYDSKPTNFGESPKNNYQNTYNNAPSFSATGNDDFMKSTQSNSQNSVKFQKVVDFTKMRPNYPTDLDFKFPTATNKPLNAFGSVSNVQNENINTNDFEEPSSKFSNPAPSFRDRYKEKEVEDVTEKQIIKPMTYTDTEFSHNSVGNYNNKNQLKGTKFNLDFKDKFKYRPWSSTNFTNDYKNAKNPLKGYQYSTNYSNTSFEFDFSGGKNNNVDYKFNNNNVENKFNNNNVENKFNNNNVENKFNNNVDNKFNNNNIDNKFNINNDEIVPASSNVVDLTSGYQFPENDYSNFKKIPNIKGLGDDFPGLFQSIKQQEKYDPADYVKSLYTTVPTTTTHWGNVYKAPEFSFKQQLKKPQFVDEITDEVVHIPKRPYSNKYNYGKYTDNKPSDWSSFNNHRPYKNRKPQNDWNKDVPYTRFKSEEDLLGLRTHDTSHPSYLPTYRPISNSLSSDYDYKKLVDKWRQSYLKAKYKDTFHDFEGFPSENKPLHVPVPKPYPIEVPHPVIVPVPQPYPVRVPVPKPVAVPVVREITVQVEKPVPYPVIKKVPYPVEKHVPVRVEKEVQVPVMKPYPVPVPHIRPVFHHSRPREEHDNIDDEEDDYLPRPESNKRVPYVKRPRSSRNRSRRPSRPTQERSRRRWPSRRPATSQRHPPRPSSMDFHSQPFKHNGEFEDFDSDFFSYCKRTGNC